MAIIPSSTQFIGIAASVNLTEKKSSQLNSETQPYTMQDIIDTAGGGGTPAGTAGQIQFSDGSAFAADSNLYWDNTNKRLGVGTSSPSSKITAQTTSAADGIVLQDASNQLALIGKWFDSSGFIDLNQSGTPYTRIQASQSYMNTPLTIGTATAISARLAVKGSGSTSATTSLLVQNSSGTQLLKVADDGVLYNGNIMSTGNLYLGASNSERYLLTSGQIHPLGNQDFGRDDLLAYLWKNSFFSGYMHITDGTASSSTYNSTAKLQLDSTTKGFLPPRGSNAQMLAIVSPAEGLIFYDNTNHKLNVFDGTSWVAMH